MRYIRASQNKLEVLQGYGWFYGMDKMGFYGWFYIGDEFRLSGSGLHFTLPDAVLASVTISMPLS